MYCYFIPCYADHFFHPIHLSAAIYIKCVTKMLVSKFLYNSQKGSLKSEFSINTGLWENILILGRPACYKTRIERWRC